jgi:hypothetical protein
MHEVMGEIEFAEKAAAHFAANPKHWSYSLAEIAPGCLVALRWGLGDDCVLVFKLDEQFTPTIYAQLVRKFQEAA